MNSTPGILCVVVTGNFDVGFIYSITILNFYLSLFVHNFVSLIVKGNGKFLYQHYIQRDGLSFTFAPPLQLPFQTHLPSYSLVHVLSPTRKSPSAPLDRCHLFSCLNAMKKSSVISLLPIRVHTAWGSLVTGFGAIFASPGSASSSPNRHLTLPNSPPSLSWSGFEPGSTVTTYEWIWTTGWMILLVENWCTQKKSCPTATLYTTNPMWTWLRSHQVTNTSGGE